MEKSGFYKYYTELPTWAKGAMAIAIIGGVGLIGYKIYKGVKNSEELKNSQDTANSAENEYKKLLRQGQKLSFPESNYISASNTVETSLSGCETYFGEEDAKYAVINVVKKPIDWYFLVTTFGSRMIDNCGWGTGETAYALPELLREQLGSISASSGNYFSTNLSILQDYLTKIGVTL
jgi:hypothetical protein